MKPIFRLALLLTLIVALPHPTPAGEQMEIRLIIGGETVPAILEDNPSSRDFMQMLPVTLTMKDYNRTEKIGDPPRKLSTKEAPDGFAPSAGDITLYAPWGNIAIFYRGFSWSKGLIPLGRITSGMEKLATLHGDFEVTFEQVR